MLCIEGFCLNQAETRCEECQEQYDSYTPLQKKVIDLGGDFIGNEAGIYCKTLTNANHIKRELGFSTCYKSEFDDVYFLLMPTDEMNIRLYYKPYRVKKEVELSEQIF